MRHVRLHGEPERHHQITLRPDREGSVALVGIAFDPDLVFQQPACPGLGLGRPWLVEAGCLEQGLQTADEVRLAELNLRAPADAGFDSAVTR